MSTGDARVKLRDVLAALGYDAQLYPPSTPAPGLAWPQWVITEPAGYCAFTHTWECYVALGGADPASTAEKADDAIEPLTDAMAAVGVVVQLEPIVLTLTDTADGVKCIRIRVQTS